MSSPEVEEVKQRLDIVDVVSEYVPLKPGGINWKGLCPFHNEKSPSFMVNRERQFWHCFGCNEGGDVFAFFQKIEHVDFPEALKLLAARAGVELKSYNPQAASLRSRLIDMHEFACVLFQQQLYAPAGGNALQYLRESRKLTDETIRAWRLGFALDDWRTLLGALKAKGYQEQDIVASGLALTSNGRTYDRFRNRIMFPVVSVHGQVVGFSARTASQEPSEPASTQRGEPKYINSPQTAIYDKGAIVYGLYQAKQSIREKDHVILVEGNMDVIASFQAGIRNVVAASGTGLTIGHIKALSRFTNEFHFCFDADSAGLRAAERGISLALFERMFVKVVAIPKELGKDPGDLVERDPNVWRTVSQSALPVMEYLLRRVEREYDLKDVAVKKRLFPWIVAWLGKIAEPVEREHYVQRVAELLTMEPSVVRSEVARAASTNAVHSRPAAGDARSTGRETASRFEVVDPIPMIRQFESVFSLAIQSDELFEYMVQHLEFEFVPDEYAELYKLIVHQYTIHNRTLRGDRLLEFLRAESPKSELRFLSTLELGKEEMSQFPQGPLVAHELRDRIERYRKRVLIERRDELARRIADAERSKQTAEFESMLNEFQTITRQLTSG